jgi:hypothetical protein
MRKVFLFLAVPALFVGSAVFSEPTEGGLIFHRGARFGCSGFRARVIRSACCCEPVQMNYGCSGTQMDYGHSGSAGLELRQPLPARNPNLDAPTEAPRLDPDLDRSGNSGPIPDTDGLGTGAAAPARPAPATFTPPLPRE